VSEKWDDLLVVWY